MKNSKPDLTINNPIFLSETRKLAIKLHGEQKYGELPYIVHLDDVAILAIEHHLHDYIQAAYLHDVIEDCGISREQLEEYTNKNTANMVWAVSGFGKNRKERKEDMIKKLYEYPKAITLKMLDRLANMKNSKTNNNPIYDMYIKELDDYMPLFKLGDAKLYAIFETIHKEENLKKYKKNKP